MKVFITGGAGFIGSHLCDVLVKEGHEVTILDNLSTGTENNIAHLKDSIKIIKGDIRDVKLVEELMLEVDLVLHMAAALGVYTILKNPIESISTNYYGSEVILNMAAKYDKRIIIASTSEIYGKNTKQPLSEEDDRIIGTPQKLRWSYSDSKALEEATAHYLFLEKNLRVTTVRLFNTVGPRQSGEFGMVIPRFVSAALSGSPLYIFGDGLQSRVFCHVVDTANAILNLANQENTIGEVFNIGGKFEISILDLAKFVIKNLKSNSEIKFKSYELAYSSGFEDMARRVPNIAKIKKYVGWEPVTPLDVIIKDVASDMIK
jgi:UDP-glucose 4-epimerase